MSAPIAQISADDATQLYAGGVITLPGPLQPARTRDRSDRPARAAPDQRGRDDHVQAADQGLTGPRWCPFGGIAEEDQPQRPEEKTMAKWFSGGDKHTGWRTPDGTKLTDNQAKRISDDLTKRQQADSDRYNKQGRTK